jgi:hypothetical protein
VADKDRMIAPETQRFMAHRARGQVFVMDVDHTPLSSAPERVHAVIADALNAVLHADRLDLPRSGGPA